MIVPPVSEKHALGRFQDEFVESRRIALERCLRKMTAHPMLYGDPDLKLFLESDSLVAEVRNNDETAFARNGVFCTIYLTHRLRFARSRRSDRTVPEDS